MLNSSEHDISKGRLICGMKFSLSQEKQNGGNLICNKKCLFISFYNFSCVSRPAIKELHFNALFTIFSSAGHLCHCHGPDDHEFCYHY